MHIPTGVELMDLADLGRKASASRKALLLMDAATAETWSIGRRDQALLTLRSEAFGDVLSCASACPRCGGRIQFELSAAELLRDAPADLPGSVRVEVAGQASCLRIPSVADLEAAASLGDPAAARAALLEAIGIAAPETLAPEALALIEEALAAADPLAEMRIALDCPVCAEAWEEHLEPALFLWEDVEAAASRLMREVHTLASAYHWSERDILSLPPTRRRFYLDCLGAG